MLKLSYCLHRIYKFFLIYCLLNNNKPNLWIEMCFYPLCFLLLLWNKFIEQIFSLCVLDLS